MPPPPPPPPTAPLRFSSSKMNSCAPPSSPPPRFTDLDRSNSCTKTDIMCPAEKPSNNAIRANDSNILAPPEFRSAGQPPPPPVPPPVPAAMPVPMSVPMSGPVPVPMSVPMSGPVPAAMSVPATEGPQEVLQLRRIVQDLTAENTILQQRVKVLMEGETMDDLRIPGLSFARNSGKEEPEVEVLLLRIRRLEAALKLEAMEREELEVRLRAQERVLVRLAKK